MQGYAYAKAAAILGVPYEDSRAHLYEARLLYRQLYEATERTADAPGRQAWEETR